MSESSSASFEPRIMAFVCKWCTYAGADLAGTSRMEYAPNVRMIRLPCSGRIDPQFLIKAFEQGADGVVVSGCHPGDCHYNEGNYHARRRNLAFRELLEFCGIDLGRLEFSWISAAEAIKWSQLVDRFTDRIRAMGPHDHYHRMTDPYAHRLKRKPA
ncbi:MAG: hydrogenase iron-sulfur subunit [Magnetococcus sp. YQC-3]